MKPAQIALLVAILALWTKSGWAELTAEQTQQVKAFVDRVHALDPHTEKSEPAFVALVEQYVPATGPARTFLDFMAASGFECPWPPGEKIDRELPTYHCAFEPDLGPPPSSLSSVTEGSWFGIIAHYDNNRKLTKLEPYMVHGFVGP